MSKTHAPVFNTLILRLSAPSFFSLFPRGGARRFRRGRGPRGHKWLRGLPFWAGKRAGRRGRIKKFSKIGGRAEMNPENSQKIFEKRKKFFSKTVDKRFFLSIIENVNSERPVRNMGKTVSCDQIANSYTRYPKGYVTFPPFEQGANSIRDPRLVRFLIFRYSCFERGPLLALRAKLNRCGWCC